MSAGECLKCSIFDSVREPENEKSAHSKIKLDIDRDEAFNYAKGKSEIYNKDDFLAMLRNEIQLLAQ